MPVPAHDACHVFNNIVQRTLGALEADKDCQDCYQDAEVRVWVAIRAWLNATPGERVLLYELLDDYRQPVIQQHRDFGLAVGFRLRKLAHLVCCISFYTPLQYIVLQTHHKGRRLKKKNPCAPIPWAPDCVCAACG